MPCGRLGELHARATINPDRAAPPGGPSRSATAAVLKTAEPGDEPGLAGSTPASSAKEAQANGRRWHPPRKRASWDTPGLGRSIRLASAALEGLPDSWRRGPVGNRVSLNGLAGSTPVPSAVRLVSWASLEWPPPCHGAFVVTIALCRSGTR